MSRGAMPAAAGHGCGIDAAEDDHRRGAAQLHGCVLEDALMFMSLPHLKFSATSALIHTLKNKTYWEEAYT